MKEGMKDTGFGSNKEAVGNKGARASKEAA